MKFKSIIEELSQDLNQTLEKIMKDIYSNSSLRKFVESVRPEVYLYKNHYSVMVILRTNLSEDQEEFAMKSVKTIADKYNAKVNRNNIVIKILLSKETNNEIQKSTD